MRSAMAEMEEAQRKYAAALNALVEHQTVHEAETNVMMQVWAMVEIFHCSWIFSGFPMRIWLAKVCCFVHVSHLCSKSRPRVYIYSVLAWRSCLQSPDSRILSLFDRFKISHASLRSLKSTISSASSCAASNFTRLRTFTRPHTQSLPMYAPRYIRHARVALNLQQYIDPVFLPVSA
jgi:hypothetical protein